MSSEFVPRPKNTNRGRGRGRPRGRGGRGGRPAPSGSHPDRDPRSSSTDPTETTESILPDSNPNYTSVSLQDVSDATRTQKPRRKSTSATRPSSHTANALASDNTKPAVKEIPPHLIGSGLDVDTLVTKVTALANHSKSESVDSRYTPHTVLDWADEDDPTALPSLDEWALPKSASSIQMKHDVPDVPPLKSLTAGAALDQEEDILKLDSLSISQGEATESHNKETTGSSNNQRKRNITPNKRRANSPGVQQEKTLSMVSQAPQEQNTAQHSAISNTSLPPKGTESPTTAEVKATAGDASVDSGRASSEGSRFPSQHQSSRSDHGPRYPRGGHRGRGFPAPHLAHLPFHPANLNRSNHNRTQSHSNSHSQSSASRREPQASAGKSEQPRNPPPERPHARPVLSVDALARISRSLGGNKLPHSSPHQQPSAIQS